MQFIEDHERSPRAWYGGAVGLLGFDGNLNTGLTLRTIRVKDGVAEVRAGATLLIDSEPDDEEAETELKACGLPRRHPRAARGAEPARAGRGAAPRRRPPRPAGRPPGLVRPHAGQLSPPDRRRGGDAAGRLPGRASSTRCGPTSWCSRPGPGTPGDFDVSGTLRTLLERGIPVFGVCLGLQGIVEHFGGELGVLDYPMHGKASRIRVLGGRIFAGLPKEFTAGRYHSLFAIREKLPAVLEVTAESEDGVVMAVEHRTLPLAAVQFHPESIMSLGGDVGLRLIATSSVFFFALYPLANLSPPTSPPDTSARRRPTSWRCAGCRWLSASVSSASCCCDSDPLRVPTCRLP